MNIKAFNKIKQIFEENKITYNLIQHPVCRTSAESAETRARAGFPNAVGAKALVVKMTFNDKRSEFNTLVLPGMARLSSPKLKALFPAMKKFRFATSEELLEICELPPGAIPPFGQSIFPQISNLFIDESITGAETVGFNVASLENSIVMSSPDYLRVAEFSSILNFIESEKS